MVCHSHPSLILTYFFSTHGNIGDKTLSDVAQASLKSRRWQSRIKTTKRSTLLTASQALQNHRMIGPMILEYIESLESISTVGQTDLLSKFETIHEETDPVELKVSGRIPAHAA